MAIIDNMASDIALNAEKIWNSLRKAKPDGSVELDEDRCEEVCPKCKGDGKLYEPNL